MLFTQFLIILTIAGELCYFGQVQARLAHNMCYVINDIIRLKGIPHVKILINRYFINGICFIKVCMFQIVLQFSLGLLFTIAVTNNYSYHELVISSCRFCFNWKTFG